MEAAVRWLVLTAFLAVGCLPTIDLEPPPVCDVIDGGVSTPSGRAVFVGRPATVIASRRAPTCPPADGVTVQVRVTDPRLAVVDAGVEGPFIRGQFHAVDVRFTPDRPGPWRVDAVFEPELGRALNEVLAVQPFEPAVRRASLPDAEACAAEGATTSGTMACLGVGTATVSFWRGGQQLQTVPGVGLEASGDAVFVFGVRQVERYVDVGGAFLRRVPDAPFVFDDALLPIDAVAAVNETRFLVASRGRVLTFALDPGAFAPVAVVSLPPGLCLGPPRLIPVDAQTFRLACASRSGFARFCRAFDDSPGACVEVRGGLVGADPQGIWVVEGQEVRRHAMAPQPMSLVLPAGWTVLAVRRWVGSLHPLAVEPTGQVFFLQEGEGLSLGGVEGGSRIVAAPAGQLLVSGAGQRVLFAR
jgi:hypothetical protein